MAITIRLLRRLLQSQPLLLHQLVMTLRYRSKAYLKSLRGKECLLCGFLSEAHHITFAEPNAMGMKVGDNWCVPMCHKHHMELHAFGDERLYWDLQGIDAISIAELLFKKFKEEK